MALAPMAKSVVLLCAPQVIGNLVLVTFYLLPDAAYRFPPLTWLSPRAAIAAFLLAAYGSLLLVGAGPVTYRLAKRYGGWSPEAQPAVVAMAVAVASTLFFFLVVERWDLPLP